MHPFWKVLRNLVWLSQLGLSIAVPLLICIGGCRWLQTQFSLGGWVMVVGIVLGIGGAVSGAVAFGRVVCRQNRDEKKPPHSFNSHD